MKQTQEIHQEMQQVKSRPTPAALRAARALGYAEGLFATGAASTIDRETGLRELVEAAGDVIDCFSGSSTAMNVPAGMRAAVLRLMYAKNTSEGR